MTAQRTRKIVPAGKARIAVIAEGEGPLLILLPSSSRDSEDFDAIAASFAAAGLRVLRPQPRGMGASVGRLEHLTLHDFAADVAAVITAEGSGPAVVLGHAFGQWIARSLAADRPDLVRGVVLAAAAAKAAPPELREHLARCVDTDLPHAIRLAALRVAFFAPGHDPSEWLSGWHKAAGAAQRAASAATSRQEWWTAGTAPVLDVQAEHDPWRPRDTLNQMRDDLGADRVTVVVIPDASHALIPEQPGKLIEAVLDWMRGLSDPA
ncbi:MAG TPA: alpha/beta hydrolase [Acetobacteraceae bacterium]|jgi:pimeloyl-ACP methyl ester carboxylesterase|nr:alpha/beta hydrolase [Acetobacteraceae bacterium]